jgi:hypothetical protein
VFDPFHVTEEVREMNDPGHVGVGELDALSAMEFVRHLDPIFGQKNGEQKNERKIGRKEDGRKENGEKKRWIHFLFDHFPFPCVPTGIFLSSIFL